MIEERHKLDRWDGSDWVEHSHAPVFERSAPGTTPRLVVGVPAGDPLVFERLVMHCAPPYQLLYVLHTPRGEGAAGRYTSPEIDRPGFRSFMDTFGEFIQRDARCDVWAHSASDRATIVWDRHQLIHAYGPLEQHETVLRTLGFQPGSPSIPSPHAHHYHAGSDAVAAQVLQAFDWSFSPLQPEDEQ